MGGGVEAEGGGGVREGACGDADDLLWVGASWLEGRGRLDAWGGGRGGLGLGLGFAVKRLRRLGRSRPRPSWSSGLFSLRMFCWL